MWRTPAAEQEGLVTIAQIDRSPDAVMREVAAGRLLRPQFGVLQVAGAATTPAGRLLAVCLSIGPHAAITGWSALWLLGLRNTLGTTVEVAVPRAREPRPRRGATIHRCSWLLRRDIEFRQGLAVTRVAATLLILARQSDEHFLRSVMIHARQQRLLTLAELRDVLARAQNAPGSAKLRRLCSQLDETDADSTLEVIFRQRWAETPWPQPLNDTLEVDTPRHAVRLDVPWPDYLTAVDCHGWGKYDSTWSLDEDTRRDNHIKATDWQVLEATWGRVTGPDWPRLVEEIVDVLDAQARRLGLAPVRPLGT